LQYLVWGEAGNYRIPVTLKGSKDQEKKELKWREKHEQGKIIREREKHSTQKWQ
jgi:hypothetical protein